MLGTVPALAFARFSATSSATAEESAPGTWPRGRLGGVTSPNLAIVNALGRFALYLLVIALPWVSLFITGLFLGDCVGDCNIDIIPVLGVAILVLLATIVACVIVEYEVRRRSRR